MKTLFLLFVSALAVYAQANCTSNGINSQGSAYTALLTDNGKLQSETGTSTTLTLPSSVPAATPQWCVAFVNASTSVQFVSPNGHNLNGVSGSIPVAPGQGGIIWSDGSNYFTTYNFPTSFTVCNTGTSSSATSSTTIVNLAACKIPAGLLAIGSHVGILSSWKYVGTAGTKTISLCLSTTTADTVCSASGAATMFNVATTSAALSTFSNKDFWNSTTLSIQKGPSTNVAPNGLNNTVSLFAATVNTANDTFINFNCLVANGGDSCAVDAYTVIVNR